MEDLKLQHCWLEMAVRNQMKDVNFNTQKSCEVTSVNCTRQTLTRLVCDVIIPTDTIETREARDPTMMSPVLSGFPPTSFRKQSGFSTEVLLLPVGRKYSLPASLPDTRM